MNWWLVAYVCTMLLLELGVMAAICRVLDGQVQHRGVVAVMTMLVIFVWLMTMGLLPLCHVE